MDNLIKDMLNKYKDELEYCNELLDEEDNNGDGTEWYESRVKCIKEVIIDLERILEWRK